MKTSNYGTARGVLAFAEIVLWCGVGLGVIIAVVAGGAASRGFGSSGLLAALPGIAIAVVSFIGVVLTQMGKATVDTADYNYQMLEVARQQLAVSHKTLSATSPPTSFADQPPANPNSASSPASAPKALPGTYRAPITDHPDWEYKGRQIHKTDRGFVVEGRTFATLDQARSHVDQGIARAKIASATRGYS